MNATAVEAAASGVALATADDDAGLRALLQRSHLPGAVRVAFTREPRYADGEALAGATDTTIVHRTDGVVDGMAHFAAHTLYRNGVARRVGYLGELRVEPEVPRRARALRDGFALLREVVAQAGVDGCVTSIVDDNTRARRVLEHGARLGLPTYTPIASLTTIVAPVTRARPAPPADAPADRDELSDFLDRHARTRHLGLTWDAARWDALARHGVGARDFVVRREHGRVVAAGALWDQRAFRQTVVCGYTGTLARVRPFANALARWGLMPPLPVPGSVLPMASVLGVAADSPAHLAALWRMLAAAARACGLSWLAIARDARDLELALLQRLARGRSYRPSLYDVHWGPRAPWTDAWDARPFCPEVGLL